MDPNTALTSILCGHLIEDHVEALRDWLRGDGFRPSVCKPSDCHEAFAEWPGYPANISADTWGVYVEYADPGQREETLSMSWSDLLRLQDSECW